MPACELMISLLMPKHKEIMAYLYLKWEGWGKRGSDAKAQTGTIVCIT
jgi:hypothetical protein